MTSNVDNDLSGKRDYLLNLNEILLALNLGLAVAIGLRVYISQFPPGRNRVADVFLRTVARINGCFRLADYAHLGANVTFVAFSATSFLAALLLVREIALTAKGRQVLSLLGGMLAIAALPICVFYSGSVLFPKPYASGSGSVLLLFVGVSLLCVFSYWHGMRPIPLWGTIPVLALYYGFWGWMSWQHFTHGFTELAFPVVGLFSCIAWGLFERRQRSEGRNFDK
jgi:hypothetical protein